MKNFLKLFLLAFIAVSLIFAGCSSGSSGDDYHYNENNNDNNDNNNNDNNNNNNDTNNEPMSGKTVMQYFIDEDIRLGWNLGNTLDGHNNGSPNETGWLSSANRAPASQELFDAVKAEGIDIVRIPCTWINLIGPAPDYTLDAARLERVAEVVGYARNAGLKAIINIHHDDTAWSRNNDVLVRQYGWLDIRTSYEDPAVRAEIKDKFSKVWTQIAARFKDYGEWLIFEGMNEVHDGDWGWGSMTQSNATYRTGIMEILNEWNQTFTDAVRATGGNNATRFLMYPSFCSNYEYILPDGTMGGRAVGALWQMPTDPSGPGRQIVTFHYYDPFNFAHDAAVTEWDTTSNRSNVINLFSRFKTHYVDNGVPVIIGEMGPRWQTDPIGQANRLTYIDFVWGEARKNGIVPVYWDDGGNFWMMNRGRNNTTPQPRDAHAAAAFEAMRTAVGR